MPPGHKYPVAQAPQETEPAPVPQGWVHRHPYVTVCVGVISLFVLVILIVSARSGVSGSDTANNWVGAGSVFFTGGRNLTQSERMTAEQVIKERSPDTDIGYIPLPSPTHGEGGDDFGNDLTKLLSLLTQPATAGGTGGSPVETSSAFSFIPQGLISTAQAGKKRSPEADILFGYGNDVGTYIQGFEGMHSNSAQILKDQAEERTNAEKKARVDRLGYEMAEFGRDMLQLETVPKLAKSAHDAYATSYRVVGTNLTKIAKAQSDEEFLDAIAVYNASVEALSKRFLALVTLFGAYEVTFSASDPGSVFMFSPQVGF